MIRCLFDNIQNFFRIARGNSIVQSRRVRCQSRLSSNRQTSSGLDGKEVTSMCFKGTKFRHVVSQSSLLRPICGRCRCRCRSALSDSARKTGAGTKSTTTIHPTNSGASRLEVRSKHRVLGTSHCKDV
ncbi:hypothetical protein KQX54_008684 [Cotesia glomerata]|uniref:Uncharacterized protein n=1 Tax=Cotesia glomerata TaxID=32391 RepID=A0AAV7HQF0_COTGL|nr:hypothetical protein KQX54_008684 [Cotesia glomerata]